MSGTTTDQSSIRPPQESRHTSTFNDILPSYNHRTSGWFVMTPYYYGRLRRLRKIGAWGMSLHDDYLDRWSTTTGRLASLGELLLTVIHRIHQVWDPWRIDGGNVTIFLILSFSLCYHWTTHVYHVDIGWFPHFLCTALYMPYPTLCLTCYHAFPVRISYVYLSYSLLLQHGRLLYNLVSSYEIL